MSHPNLHRNHFIPGTRQTKPWVKDLYSQRFFENPVVAYPKYFQIRKGLYAPECLPVELEYSHLKKKEPTNSAIRSYMDNHDIIKGYGNQVFPVRTLHMSKNAIDKYYDVRNIRPKFIFDIDNEREQDLINDTHSGETFNVDPRLYDMHHPNESYRSFYLDK